MHISLRTSGGRGEYEVVGSHSGLSAASLEGWEFHMRWPDGLVRDTGLWLDPAGSGKPRLRSLLSPPIQIGRITSSMLLLPSPIRDVRKTRFGWPVLQAGGYSVTQLGFAPESEFAAAVDRVTFVPSWVEVANTSDSEAIGVASRWSRIAKVYSRVGELPTIPLQTSLTAHRDFMATGATVDGRLGGIVRDVSVDLAAVPDLQHDAGSDPLPVLEFLLSIEVPDEPGLPPPNELSEDEPEINLRSAHQYRLAKSRGASGRRFSDEVLRAYNFTCAFCGARFGNIEGVRSGIDAAHILAWSKHDLDVVPNGIALCKLHHWAFDAGLLLVIHDGTNYVLRYTTVADRLTDDSRARLGVDRQILPESWLPSDPSQRPSQKYLTRAYADLGVSVTD